MITQILSLGCNWWARPGKNPNDRYRFTRSAAFFNSTGIRRGRKMTRSWLISGMVRFNGNSDFNSQYPLRVIGRTYECSEVTSWMGGNRLLIKARTTKKPDNYILTLSSGEQGTIDCTDAEWKSQRVIPLALSQRYETQETMLLMEIGDWITTDCGRWILTRSRTPIAPELRLE